MIYSDFYEGRGCFISTLYTDEQLLAFHNEIINSETVAIDFMTQADRDMFCDEIQRCNRLDLIKRVTLNNQALFEETK